jgi:two-component system, NtrC family, sensor kinase
MDEPIKILCVDDEQNVLSAIKRLFIDEDYIILTAGSGQEGLELLEKEHVQLIISDYRMPVMNGVEFLRDVYRRRPETVRIVLSGYADAAAIVEAINEGHIYKFIPKPWNDNELKVTVSNALERYFLFKKNMELNIELQKKNEDLTKLNVQLERLLKEEAANLEFRSRVLAAHQHMLDSMPVAIAGLDFNNTIVMCNIGWKELAGDKASLIGQDAAEIMPGDTVKFIEEVKESHGSAKKTEINGLAGKLLGSLIEYSDGQKGIILVFVREDGLK